jgi:hypothetical protein
MLCRATVQLGQRRKPRGVAADDGVRNRQPKQTCPN